MDARGVEPLYGDERLRATTAYRARDEPLTTVERLSYDGTFARPDANHAACAAPASWLVLAPADSEPPTRGDPKRGLGSRDGVEGSCGDLRSIPPMVSP